MYIYMYIHLCIYIYIHSLYKDSIRLFTTRFYMPQALRYHDTSVLENFHLATAFELMRARHNDIPEGAAA